MEPRSEHRQRGYRVRLEWGPHGVEVLAADCAVLVVVDVLSFCTSVDIAVGRGAAVLPQRDHDPAAAEAEAERAGAVPAGRRDGPGPSLRPSSLLGLAAGTTLALRSPNGATLCAAAAAAGVPLLAGCLRNAGAVAAAADRFDGPVGLVAAGERWPDGTLRVAVEDAVGAGAIAARLRDRSTEADLAAAQFAAARARGLLDVLAATSSGRELLADGYGADVALAAALDASRAVPALTGGLLAGSVRG
ncbi:2-phosphosulfolactate phosphatase [Pseudonocardia humida]|uniref:Probable 2-phosphosulfolactate phosphatase n=1 Tax=Pseudonocardia humida TaxID=2800819 RepID=A0ABT1A5R6_9PSEU|nr:2-phosphosulfolactate phosphatase [Pseudonocardia humida]MCO1658316.1 2-phosphosulfolactate phosphatase [Pseudonocardia humida]